MPNGSGVPESLRRRVFREDGLRCSSCGAPGFEKRVLCTTCNTRKGVKNA